MGFRDVTVVNPDGQEDTLENGFEYTSVSPIIKNIKLPSGPLKGETPITITGEGFIESISNNRIMVKIGNIFVEEVQFISSTKLTVITPERTEPGDVWVTVTNPDEQQASGNFKYNPFPTITSILPDRGKLEGGTKVTITGDNFIKEIPGLENELTVKLDNIAAESLNFISEKELSIIIPERENPGKVDVLVINPDGQQAKTKFTYNSFPTITGISPSNGNPNVITPVIIEGENFIKSIEGIPEQIRVNASNIPISDKDIQFLSSNELRVFMPESPQSGTVSIIVTNPDGQSSEEEVEYTYNAPPSITEITPKTGTAGTEITLTGENFIASILDEHLKVTIAGIQVDTGSVTSSEIKFIAPDFKLFGDVPVIVINPDRQEDKTTFTYIPRPTVQSISTVSGSLSGGTKITIKGSGFVEQIDKQRIQVKFGDSAVPDEDVKFISSSELKVTTPKNPTPDTVDIIVTNPDGQSSKKSSDATFTYNPFPKINKISPSSGKLDGGTEITITGEQFIPKISGEDREHTVTIGGIPATSVLFVSAQELRVNTPARNEAGDVLVVVTNPDGQPAEDTFTYNPPPTITDISPPSGKLDGGTKIAITGTEFTKQISDYEGKLTVTIGGITQDVQFISDTQLTITTPEHEPGEIDIIVTNPDGQYAKAKFTYNPLPKMARFRRKIGRLPRRGERGS